MKNYIIIFIFLLIKTIGLAQNIYVKKADSLFDNNEFDKAALLYEKSFFVSNDANEKSILLIKKSECLKYQNKITEALNTLNRIKEHEISISLKAKLFLKIAFLNRLVEEINISNNYLYQYKLLTNDSLNLDYLLLKILNDNSTENYDEARKELKIYCKITKKHLNVDSLYKNYLSLKRKNSKLAKRLSIFLPGLGQMYNGDYIIGITNILMISGVSAYVGYNILTQQYSAAALSSAFLFQIWVGGAKNAKNTAIEYNNNLKNQFNNKIKQILIKNYNYEAN